MKDSELDAVYRRYMHDIYRYLHSLCRDHHTAEDVMQETFYRAYLYVEHYTDESVKPWLFKVAYRAFVDRKRREGRIEARESAFFEQLPAGRTPEQDVLLCEQRKELDEAIALLPDLQRQAVLLHDVQDFTYKEAAEIMGIGLANFKISLFRARQKLRQARGETE